MKILSRWFSTIIIDDANETENNPDSNYSLDSKLQFLEQAGSKKLHSSRLSRQSFRTC